MRVGLFISCLVDVMAPEVGVAAVRVLRAAGHDVEVPRDQTCCGQPAWNAGFAAESARVAKTTLDAFDAALASGVECIVGLAGSCTAMSRVFWPELFEVAGDHESAERAHIVAPRIREFTEFVAEHGLAELSLRPRPQGPAPKVGYHHSCHMLRELRIKEPPERLLAAAGCDRMPWSADERCCGFGGTFSIKLPETSTAMADDKLTSLADSGADELVGADTSCLLHLRSRAEHEGRPVPTRHIAEVLADAIETGDR